MCQVHKLQLLPPHHHLPIKGATREQHLMRHFSLLPLQPTKASDSSSVLFENVEFVDSAANVIQLHCAVPSSAQKTVVP